MKKEIEEILGSNIVKFTTEYIKEENLYSIGIFIKVKELDEVKPLFEINEKQLSVN